MMRMIKLDKLVETPYMMEIVVQVLPLMTVENNRDYQFEKTFIKNFSGSFYDFIQSTNRIKKTQQQKLKRIQQKSQKQIQIDIQLNQQNQIKDDQFNVSEAQKSLDKINYQQYAIEIWNEMEQNQILRDFQLTDEMDELQYKIQNNYQNCNKDNKFGVKEVISILKINDESIIQLICDALKEQNLTGYDFYEEFIKQYHLKQIEKYRNLRKSISVDRFLHDLLKYSIKLAKQMSNKDVTQIQFKKRRRMKFFNDDKENGPYKKDLRSCSLIQQKGTKYQFLHKSIQEFLIAVDLYELFAPAKDFDFEILTVILGALVQKNDSDYHQLNTKELIEKHFSRLNFVNNLLNYDKQKQFNCFQENSKKIIDFIKKLKIHDFNLLNYSTKSYGESRKFFIQKILKEEKIIEVLKFLFKLTARDEQFIQCGSNSLNLLVEMKIDLSNQSFQNIRIRNTSLIGANFAKCDLSCSELENVKINGINLNGALLFNCKWINLQINELHQINGHMGSILSVCFSSDVIQVSGYGMQIQDKKRKDQKDIPFGSNQFAFSPDVKIIQSVFGMQKQDKKKKQLLGHNGGILSICFSPDGFTLTSGSNGTQILLWDVKLGQQKKILQGDAGSVQSVFFSPDGTLLASGCGINSIQLWDLNSGLEKLRLEGHNDFIYSVCFFPGGNILASGSNDKNIRLWDVKSGQEKKILEGHTHGVQSICFSPDGATLASCSSDKSICLWDISSGQEKRKFEGHTGEIQAICYSPDGTILASGSKDNSIRLWDVKSWEEKKRSEGHDDKVLSVCFSPDGSLLESGSKDNSIRLWDISSGQEKKRLQGHTGGVKAVCFSPDSTTLASGSKDNSIHIWDIKSGEEKTKSEGNNGWVSSVCYSPDGSTLASGSRDNSIRLWDINQGLEEKKLIGHNGVVYSVSYTPDGSKLASASGDQSIRLWDVNIQNQFGPTYQNNLDIHLQFNSSNNKSNQGILSTIRISQNEQLEAYATKILKGQFINQLGMNLLQLFQQKGSVILDNDIEFMQNEQKV
ncbi:unnamed protein product [Paramecium sonneborni]|uniref:Transcription factor spt8 beta-propeller domain-containing protein n=1 Tax=Paramecium sonneborni TaxID=65129 RepID=A0A8S1QZ83_9CILI|nr:unnamed protein product [Paramecium sonneborni]